MHDPKSIGQPEAGKLDTSRSDQPIRLDYEAPPPRLGRRRALTVIALFCLLLFLVVRVIIVPPRWRPPLGAFVAAARAEIADITTALDAFQIDTGAYPTAAQGLAALNVAPLQVENWHGPYIRKPSPVRDPWGTPYIYVFPGIRNKNGFDLSSAGPDMTAGTKDDINN